MKKYFKVIKFVSIFSFLLNNKKKNNFITEILYIENKNENFFHNNFFHCTSKTLYIYMEENCKL